MYILPDSFSHIINKLYYIILKCFKLLLTAIQVWTLCYISIWHEDDFPILDNPLDKRRERWQSLLHISIQMAPVTCSLQGRFFFFFLEDFFLFNMTDNLIQKLSWSQWPTATHALPEISKCPFILRKLQLLTTDLC